MGGRLLRFLLLIFLLPSILLADSAKLSVGTENAILISGSASTAKTNIGTAGTGNFSLLTNNTVQWYIDGTTGALTENGTGGLTLTGSLTAADELTLTDGTETLTIDFDSTIPRIISSDTILQFGVADTVELGLSSAAFYPQADGGNQLGTGSVGWKLLALSDVSTTLETCNAGLKGVIQIDGNAQDCADTAGTMALCICDGTSWQLIIGVP